MAGPKVLVVTTTAQADEARLREVVPEGAEVRVVAPATKISPLDWLTNDEDDARAEAAQAAEGAAAALDGEAAVEVDRTSHNTDAAQDIRDALREFPADEIVVVTSPEAEQSWLEEDTVREAIEAPGVPVRRVQL
jgi:hypothetical protein